MNNKTYLYVTIFGGWLGLHKFLTNKPKTGVLYLFTFGLFGIGWIIDIIAACSQANNSAYNKPFESQKSFDEMEEEIYFEDHFLDHAEKLYDQFYDVCWTLEKDFYDNFDLNHRIKMLEKAVQKYEKWKNFCYEKGNAGIAYFNENCDDIEKYPFPPVERDMNGEYVDEFETADFRNIDFLTDLLNEYKTNPEKSKSHLKEEYIYYCGGQKEYDLMLKRESLPKDLLKVIQKNSGILQKDLYPLFDAELKSIIPTTIKELAAANKITMTKSKNSYALSIKTDSDNISTK